MKMICLQADIKWVDTYVPISLIIIIYKDKQESRIKTQKISNKYNDYLETFSLNSREYSIEQQPATIG